MDESFAILDILYLLNTLNTLNGHVRVELCHTADGISQGLDETNHQEHLLDI